MRTPFKNPLNSFAPIFLVLMAVLLLGFGCNTSKPIPDPLAGFHRADEADMDKNKAITDDYKDYIQKFSQDEKAYLGPILYYENGQGQHIVTFEVDKHGKDVWDHYLFYDKNNKRIKTTIKYTNSGYRS